MANINRAYINKTCLGLHNNFHKHTFCPEAKKFRITAQRGPYKCLRAPPRPKQLYKGEFRQNRFLHVTHSGSIQTSGHCSGLLHNVHHKAERFLTVRSIRSPEMKLNWTDVISTHYFPPLVKM